MSRTNVESARLDNPFITTGLRYGITQLTDVAQTLDADMGPVLYMVPTAGRTITLPTVTAAMRGLTFIVINGAAGAFSITVNNAAATTIMTVVQNGSMMIVCTGEPPAARGWVGA